jgi:hypothetical protein
MSNAPTSGCENDRNRLDTLKTPTYNTGVTKSYGAANMKNKHTSTRVTSIFILIAIALMFAAPLAGEEADRVVLVGHPFGAEAGVEGTEIRSLVLTAEGNLVDKGMRLDVADRPTRIAFVPSGRFALVLGEHGTLTSIAARNADELAIADRVKLPEAGAADLLVAGALNQIAGFADGASVKGDLMTGRKAPARDETNAYVTIADVGEESGVYTVRVGGDGSLELEEKHLPMRLAEAMAFVPTDARQAVLLGGQALFEPEDPRDIRLLLLDPGGWTEIGAFDIFHDMVDASGIAVSADGRTLLVPNGSPYSSEGGQISVVEILDKELVERDRLSDLPDARKVRFAPDGQTALVSRFEPGRITVLLAGAGNAKITGELSVPLADDMAIIARGKASGKVLVPSVHPSRGSEIAVLQVKSPGEVVVLERIPLGSGYINIPGAIGVAP